MYVVGTAVTNLAVVQNDDSGTSARVSWGLPASFSASGFTVLYQTSGSSKRVSIDCSECSEHCTDCSVTLSRLVRGLTYNISVVTESEQLPSGLVGPVNIILGEYDSRYYSITCSCAILLL